MILLIERMIKMIVPDNFIYNKNVELTPGGHIIEIISVEDYYKNGNPSLKINFDIKEGSDLDGYFKRLYDSYDSPYKKWPNNGSKYLSLKVNAIMFFQQFVEVLEKSNNISLVIKAGEELDLEQFKGLRVAGEFTLVEYKKDDEVRNQVILTRFKKIDQVNFIDIPPVQLLDGYTMNYEDYLRKHKNDFMLADIQHDINDLEDVEEFNYDVINSEITF